MDNNDVYLAHYDRGSGREQTLAEHLAGVAELAERFAAAFGRAELGRLCGLAHDLGKYSEAFQGRIRGADIRVDHSTAGCRELLLMGHAQAALCVAGHHGGLPDLGDVNDGPGKPTLTGRRKRTIPPYDAWKNEVTLPAVAPPKPQSPAGNAMLTRMVGSCLVDADFLDTERHMTRGGDERAGGASVRELFDMLMRFVDEKGYLRPKGEVNGLRAQVLSACIGAGNSAPGLFSLTVPTGGGKTIASLAFALAHAVKNGMTRVIYVIPYCSIIDQTAEVFRGILGKQNVLEHHAGATYETNEDGLLTPEGRQMALASENWDMPVVVTTSVQFFESIYANKPSRIRKLHNIARSVIVFDEAQMLPTTCLLPCVSAIGQLIKQFGASAVLCTATRPALDGLFERLEPGLTRRELVPNTEDLYLRLKRVTFRMEGELNDDALAARLNAHRQVLCIVNSRRQAQSVYERCAGDGVIHLSTLMIPAHRARLIDEIRRRLCDGSVCRVIATSLIEAGVDVDFPAVYRAAAGLDSILQAAGRCNREGRRPARDSVVTIFEPSEPPPAIFEANIGAMREIVPLYDDISSPQAVEAYFGALLDIRRNLDKYGVMDAFDRGIGGNLYPFATVAGRFRLIEDNTKTVYVPIDEGEALVYRLRRGEASRELFRELGRYGVTVYAGHYNALYGAGDIEIVGEDTAVLVNTRLYDDKTGLSMNADEGKAQFV